MPRSVGLFWFPSQMRDSFRWTSGGISHNQSSRGASFRGGWCYVSACIFFIIYCE